MLKSDIAEAIVTRQPELPKEDVLNAVHAIFDKLTAHLSDGGRIEIRGFGAFSLAFRASRLARNPKTGKKVSAPARYAVRFKPGTRLKELVDQA